MSKFELTGELQQLLLKRAAINKMGFLTLYEAEVILIRAESRRIRRHIENELQRIGND